MKIRLCPNFRCVRQLTHSTSNQQAHVQYSTFLLPLMYTGRADHHTMRSFSLFRHSLASMSFSRAFTTTTTPHSPSTFTLDRNIFNETLYSQIRTFWFADLPPNFTSPNPTALKRWWGLDATKDEKQQVDTTCRDQFATALEDIGPETLQLPPFESHKAEILSATSIASPLFAEIEAANSHSAKQAADTLLSLVILLDQIPRNIFRTQDTLPLVYNHYDRLAQALVHSCMKLDPNPLTFPDHMKRPALQAWINMPLLHSEDIRSHELWDQLTAQMEASVSKDDVGGRQYLERGRSAWITHVEAIRKFGRYPHRNACLERESSREEKDWLIMGETFGVSQGKDEL
jgi:uncharacterized protein (DUF924 family)